MKYLHENNTDNRSLSDIIDAIDNGEGYSSYTYSEIMQHPWKYGNAIPISTYVSDNYLTSNEVSALDDTDTIEDKRNKELPESDTYQDHPWMTVVAKFIESIPESAFDITRGKITTDATWESDIENKYMLHLIEQDYKPSLSLIQKQSSVFTIDTIENAGKVYNDDGYGGFTNSHEGIWWATFPHPNNPYHESNSQENADAIRLRGFVAMAVDIMMKQSRYGDAWFITRYNGFDSMRIGYVVEKSRYLLPPLVKKYIDQFISQTIAIEEDPKSHAGTQSHMDNWKWGGLQLCRKANDRFYYHFKPRVREAIDQTFPWADMINKRFQDHDGGYDGSYGGIKSNAELISYIQSDDDVDKVHLQRDMQMQQYVLLPEPTVEEGNKFRRYMDYTGSNVATEDGLAREQWSWASKQALISYLVPEGGWRGWDTFLPGDFNPALDEADMVSLDASSMDSVETDTPPVHNTSRHWTHLNTFYYDEIMRLGDVYQTLRNRKDLTHEYLHAGDPDILKPMYFRDGNFTHLIGGDTGKIAFAKYDDFGAQLWNVDLGFRGVKIAGTQGSVGAFWRKETGSILLSKHRGTQSSKNDGAVPLHELNNLWANQLLGQLDTGEYFSTAYTDGGKQLRKRTAGQGSEQANAGRDNRVFNHDETNSSFHVELSNNLNPMRHDHDIFTNTVEKSEIHDIDSTGWTVEKHLLNTGSTTEQMISLVEQLPVVLGGFDQYVDPPLPPEDAMSVEFDAGSGFSVPTQDSWVAGVKVIKLIRYNTPTYIVFDTTEHPNGLDVNFTSDQSHFYYVTYIGKILIDIHPNRGTATTIPSDSVIKYKIQVNAPS